MIVNYSMYSYNVNEYTEENPEPDELDSDYWQTKYDAFRLNTASEKECSFFEVVMVIDRVQYRYSVELNRKK